MTRGRAFFLVAALVAFLIAERATLAGSELTETTFDSGIFLRCAAASPFELDFYRAVRPPTVPLLYRLVGATPTAIGWLQSLLSVAAWFGFGLSLASLFASRFARALAVVVPCALSLTVPINQWDGVVMSESVFLSLMLLATALTLGLARHLTGGGRAPGPLLAAWFLVVLLFACCRDSAIYLLAVPFGAGLVAAFGRAHDRGDGAPARAFALPLVLGGLAIAAGYASMRSSERWRTPLVNVLLKRVVPDDARYTEWVEQYGLPRNATFEAQAGNYAWNRVPGSVQLRKALDADPALADVERWLQTRGVASYQRYLLLDAPLRSALEAREGFELGANPRAPIGAPADGEPRERSYSKGSGITDWSVALTRGLYASIPAPVAVGGVVLLAALVLALSGTIARPTAVLALLLMLGAFSQAFVTWHGDAAEPERHTLVVGVLFRLALLALALGAVDLVDLVARGRTAPVAPDKSAASA